MNIRNYYLHTYIEADIILIKKKRPCLSEEFIYFYFLLINYSCSGKKVGKDGD